METPHTPSSKRSLLRRLKGWFGSAEQQTPNIAETSVHETIIETPVTPVASIITPELPAQPADQEPAHTQKSPVAAPKAIRKKRVAAPKAKKKPAEKEEKKTAPKSVSHADLLDVLPVDTNLIGKVPVEITIGGKKHVLAFRNEHIILDGHNYHVIKDGVTLDIEDAKRIGAHLDLVIGAFGKTETIVFEADEMSDILAALLTHGTYKNEDRDLVITRF